MTGGGADFVTHLAQSVIVGDGGMGTTLYDRGVFINRCFDELNLSHPDLVRGVHHEFVSAGSGLIETNTFGANRIKLAAYGLETKTIDINAAGVRLAREAAGSGVYVAGAMGPIGQPRRRLSLRSEQELAAAFAEQARALADAGADLLMLETFASLKQLLLAFRAARSVAPDLPIVAQATFDLQLATPAGDRPEDVVLMLEREGAVAAGANCSSGPKQLLDVARRMAAVSRLPLSVQPNAGPPQLVEGRYLYLTSPEYLAEYARRYALLGARIVGGCCGTSPNHIKEVATFIRSISGKQDLRPARIDVSGGADKAAEPSLPPVPLAQRTELASKFADPARFITSVEIAPPKGADADKTLDGVKMLRDAGIDAVNVPDGPRATARISPLALSLTIQQRLGMPAILHYCCRDRNILGMQADLLGAHLLGVRNVLLVTGDPPKLGDYPDATAVFDVDSIGLTRIATRLNHGQDMAGHALGSQTALFIGVGANPAAVDLELEYDRFARKVEAGAEYVLTQPVFDTGLLERFLAFAAPKGLPVLVGILPLASYRNAQFLHNEVPGMSIPAPVMDRMARAGEGKAGAREGIAIARGMLEAAQAMPGVRGAYIMPPFGRARAALAVLGLDDSA